MILEREERMRFIQYCQICAKSATEIAIQLEKMPPPMDQLAKNERAKATSYMIVAQDMSRGEEMSIG